MCKFLFSKQKNNTKTISKRQIKLCKQKMNSVKVQPLSLYRNEVRWRKQHRSLLEKADNSWCHFRPLVGEMETLLGIGQEGGGTCGTTKKLK